MCLCTANRDQLLCLLGLFALVMESIMSAHPSAHLRQHRSPGHIFMKFVIEDLYENLLRKSKFGYNH